MAFEKWAGFCRACAEQPRAIETRGTFTSADVEYQLDLSLDEVKKKMNKDRMEAVELLSRGECPRMKI